MGTFANGEESEDPDEIAFHQGQHFLQRLKQSTGTEMNILNILTSTCYLLKYTVATLLCLLYQYVWEHPPEYEG